MRLLHPVFSLCLGILFVSTAKAQAPQLPTPGPKATSTMQPVPLPDPDHWRSQRMPTKNQSLEIALHGAATNEYS